jgi:hypothetical protein
VRDEGLVRSEITGLWNLAASPWTRFPQPGASWRAGYRRHDAVPHKGARHPSGVGRRVDLPRSRWPHPGGRHGRGGPPQYRYHDRWRELRDREKFDRVPEFGRTLPKIRAVVDRHLNGRGPLSKERVLAAAVRLIDLGFFRPGGDEYAADNGSYGLATISREHVRFSRNGEISFDYIGKSGKNRPSSTPAPSPSSAA